MNLIPHGGLHHVYAYALATGTSARQIVWARVLLSCFIVQNLFALGFPVLPACTVPYVDSQFASLYALSAFVALRTKGLSFEVVLLDLAESHNASPDYKETSLTGRVPTLVCVGFALSESSAIAEYLEELQPLPRLYPSSPQARAHARQVQAWLRSELLALRQDRSTEVIFYRPTASPLSPAGEVAAQKLLQAASALLAHGEDHMFGQWCIADLDLTVMLNRLVLNGDQVPDALARYARRQWQLAAVQEWLRFPRPAL